MRGLVHYEERQPETLAKKEAAFPKSGYRSIVLSRNAGGQKNAVETSRARVGSAVYPEFRAWSQVAIAPLRHM